MISQRGSFIVLSSLLLLSQGAAAQSVTNTWNGNFGSWNTAANWTPNGVPNNTNGVHYTATVNSGGPQLQNDVLLDVLNYNGGDITGQYDMTVANALNLAGTSSRVLGISELFLSPGSQSSWTGGDSAIWGSSELNNAGIFIVGATTDLSLTIDPLHIASDPNNTFGGTIVNDVSGVFIVTGPANLTVGIGFNNAGIVIQNNVSSVYNGNVVNTGTFQQNSGTLLINGSFNQTSGSYYVGSAAALQGNVVFSGGRLGGTGTISPYGNLPITTGAVLDPGNGPGQAGRLTTTTKLVLAGGGVLHADIGGTTAGVTYDQVVAANFPSVDGGVLEISLINHFIPSPGDSFTILTTSDGSFLSGSFADVASGLRLFTMDDDGTFLVLYGTGANSGQVVLTDFEATPEPGVTALVAAATCCCLLIRRRRVTS
jgi:hypothetical protein